MSVFIFRKHFSRNAVCGLLSSVVFAPSKHDSDCVSFVQPGNLIIHLSVFEFHNVFFYFNVILIFKQAAVHQDDKHKLMHQSILH